MTKTSTCFKGSYSLIVVYSRTVSNYFESKSEELMIAYFTVLVGDNCSHMMITGHWNINIIMY